jgi:hypothetical protein
MLGENKLTNNFILGKKNFANNFISIFYLRKEIKLTNNFILGGKNLNFISLF